MTNDYADNKPANTEILISDYVMCYVQTNLMYDVTHP